MEAAEVSRNLDCEGGVKETFTKVIFVISMKNSQKQKGKLFKHCSLQVTKQQIEDYSKETEEFFQKLLTEGPGVVGDDLDKGKWINVCEVML